MAIGFRGIDEIGSGGATDPMSAASLPASTTDGDLVVMFVGLKYGDTTTINTPTDWNLVSDSTVANSGLTNGSNDEGNVRAAIFWRIKDAGWSTMPAVDLSGAPNCTMVGAIAYSLGGGETWDTPIGASAADNAVSNAGVNPSASGTTIDLASGDWLASFGVLNGNLGTLGTHTCTVTGVTFGASNNRLSGSTTSGSDMLAHVIDMAYSSGTASAGPDGNLPVTSGDSNGAGVMSFVRLRLAGGDATASPGVIATTVAMPAATIEAHADVTPATITAPVTIPQAVASQDVLVTPAAIATVVTMPDPAAYGYDTGPFSIDFSIFGDGGIPEEATALRDAFLDIPDSQDEMGIRSGKLAVVNFRGPDQDFSAGGGRRGLLWRNTYTLTDNVSGIYDGSMYTPSDPDVPAFGPCLHISLDPSDLWVGISAWFVPPPFSWAELGVLGYEQEDFSYLDLMPGIPFPTTSDDVRLRSVGGFVSVEFNGETILGPCEIPAEILASPIHGIQMDVAADTDEELGVMESITIASDSTPLAERPAPTTPGVGTAVEVASSTTIDVPYPASPVAGETLYVIVLARNGGTISASGWTDVPTSFGGALNTSIRCMYKVATGSESGNLTVTKSTAGVMAGVMVRVADDRPESAVMAGAFNGSGGTNLTSPASKLFGPLRTGIWMAATSIDTDITDPGADWTPLSVGVTGGQAVRLAISVSILDDHADMPASPFNAYDATNFVAQVGTAAASTNSAVGMLILTAAYGVAGDADITPATIVTTVAAPAATVTAGVDMTPATIDTPVTMPVATPQASADVTPAAISTPVTMPQAVPNESIDVTPAAINTPVTLPAATVTAGVDVTPSPIDTPITLPAATPQASADITPATIDTPVTIPQALAESGVDVTPATIVTTVTMPATTVTASADVTPVTINTPIAFPQAEAQASADVTPVTISTPVTIPQALAEAGVDATPASIATTVAMGQAVATADVDVTPVTIATTVLMPAATVTTSVEVTPAPIDTIILLPQASATDGAAGDASVFPNPIVTAVSMAQAVVSADLDITPSTIVASVQMPAATVTAGVDVTPAPISVVIAMPQALVQASADVTPAPITTSITVPPVSATAGADVTPATIVTSVNMLSVNVTASVEITPATIVTIVAMAQALAAGAVNPIDWPDVAVGGDGVSVNITENQLPGVTVIGISPWPNVNPRPPT